METLSTIKTKIAMQYALEHFIECYNKAAKESDRYYTKLELIEFIQTGVCSVKDCLDYMNIQPEKFGPFISMLSKVDFTQPNVKPAQTFEAPRIIVYSYRGDR